MGEFDFKTITKGDVKLMIFSGKLGKDCLGQLETCRKELGSSSAKIAVIHFKNVTAIDHCTYRDLVLLQQEIRKLNTNLFVTGLDTSQKQALLDKAVIRQSEIRKGLEEILGEL